MRGLCTFQVLFIYNIISAVSGLKSVTENEFRDRLVLQIISSYGKKMREERQPGRPSCTECRVKHGSTLYSQQPRSRCQFCLLHRCTNWTQQKCLDCLFSPALCQTWERDCHSAWHENKFDGIRGAWFCDRQRRQSNHQLLATCIVSQMNWTSPPFQRKVKCVDQAVHVVQ